MKSSNYSLRKRLLLSASVLLIVFLGVMGLALTNVLKQNVVSNAEDALRNQVLLLMANIEVIDDVIEMPSVLSEPRLTQADSSLYAQIETSDGGNIWRSDSLLGLTMPVLPHQLGKFQFFERVDWPDGPSIYAMSLGVVWETEQGDMPFTVQVAEKDQAYLMRMARYQRQIGFWLAGLGASLLAVFLLLLSWGLKPLVRVTKQVGEIEQGERRRFDENYPREVSRLTQNLNQLLNFEEQRINRQKEVLGNLAHSLKTPIAVMHGLSYKDENQAEAEQQLSAMQTIIDYQLQSASAVGRRRFAKPIDIQKATQQIINSLSKLHAEKNLHVELSLEESVQFYGDPGDWMELVGNLLDNAFKWAKGRVAISVTNSEMDSHRSATRIEVSDDGIGIDDALKATIMQRGVRLDSQTPGHGLGLHIVKGIVEAYDGELSISDADPNGTVFTATLN